MWPNNRIPDANVFVLNSTYPSNKLGKRLRMIGWDYKCKICEITEWCGEHLTFHVDHINGIVSDHRLENLRFLCPNCHQQTDNWGGKNVRKGRVA
jgi:5-methylcytosine-specific restriction endonuclease McrA